ncbi:nitroreductase family deazaflavin-dependent oxidoreductase [Actinospica durhamensis]|uniref:Nitroreductase family deazaflavin-dependent oxidoreductase n=1 Tax=Actinospica durhamensis TaxID=1508375 RepID=A0A941ISL3_9ACTN|nr:hypothetical protein [Actinospica durhamensis]MBR7838634.1 nitroreductase family deazaflavin-dependent oxidoreductase [Actinospica durhamensis]
MTATGSGSGNSGDHGTSSRGLKKRVRTGFLRLLNLTLNRLTRRLAHAGRGPFSVVVHTGRRSGREYRTPLVLVAVPEGFVVELTYGPNVDWLRNVEAAGGCTVVYRGAPHRIVGVEPCDIRRGRRAFPRPVALVLAAAGARHFRILREAHQGTTD